MTAYAELLCRSAFSFGEGASSPEDLVDRAAELGMRALAITDRDAVYGLPRAHKQSKGKVPLICGARVTLDGGPGLALLVRDHRGWASLCRLITRARCGPPADLDPVEEDADVPRPLDRSEAVKGRASLPLGEVLARAEGLEAVLVGDWAPDRARRVREVFGSFASWAVSRRLDSGDERRMARTRQAAAESGIPVVATADVLMHDPARKPLQDVLTAIRLHRTLDQAGRLLEPNAARCLTSPRVMARLFRGHEHELERSVEVADRCRFTLDQLAYRYPREVVPDGQTPMAWLRHLVKRGLDAAFPQGLQRHLRATVERELRLIEKLEFAPYFLTVYDAVRFAREADILCQGRGSAANSVVCYALGITSVDPASFDLLFERFISEERGEPPDIDVDFEHERREEVIQYIYEKYGRHRAAMVATVISWRRRSAVREAGKAFGLSVDQVDRLAKLTRWSPGDSDDPHDPGAPNDDLPEELPVEGAVPAEHQIGPDEVRAAGLDPADPAVRLALDMAGQMEGLPRHMSIHVGGFTISDGPLIELVPVEPASMEGRTILQWDKDDIDIVRFVKVDVLALGMLTAIHKAFDLIQREHHFALPPGSPLPPRLHLTSIAPDDDRVFDMIGRSDTLGVFQIESRAQMSMLPRLKPRNYYDLVVEISLVRPGPIQGGMVHPYLRRRTGEEPVTYAHPKLRPILERTLGVPIFQEQVMAVAVAIGGFTPGQADELRRAMGAFRKRGKLEGMTGLLRRNMAANGVTPEYCAQISHQIEGFGEYGFPESHAASFARLVWISSWLRAYHPAAFAASLLNSQPMGFYSPRSIVGDAQRHGVEVRPVDVQYSDWDCTLEPGVAAPRNTGDLPDGRGGAALRLGFREVLGMREDAGRLLMAARQQDGPFRDLSDLARRTGLGRDTLARLAKADALRRVPHAASQQRPPRRKKDAAPQQAPSPAEWNRREALWAVRGLYDLPLFRGLAAENEATAIPAPTPVEELESDFRATGLSVDRHPLGLVRKALDRRGVLPAVALADIANGEIVRVAGLVTHRQRPGTAKGMVFMTLEDETGMMNLAVRPDVFERQRTLIVTSDLLVVRGKVQRDGAAMSLLGLRFWALPYGPAIGETSRNFR